MIRFMITVTVLGLTMISLAGCATGGGAAGGGAPLTPAQIADLQLDKYEFTFSGVVVVKEENNDGQKTKAYYLKVQNIQAKGNDLSIGWMDRMQKVQSAAASAARRGPFKLSGISEYMNGEFVTLVGSWNGTNEFWGTRPLSDYLR